MAVAQRVQASEGYDAFVSAISEKPEAFLHPTDALYATALVVSKRLVDPLAQDNSVFDQLYTDGMHIDQIWEQLKSITENVVDDVLEMDPPPTSHTSGGRDQDSEMEQAYAESDAESQTSSLEDADEGEDSASVIDASEADDIEDDRTDLEEALEDGSEMEQEVESINSAVDELIKDSTDPAQAESADQDQFFDAEEFNKQMDMMDANYEAEQEADDIDYNADPDELSGSDGDDDMVLDGEENANELRYDDFFARPKERGRKPTKPRQKRARFEDSEEAQDTAALPHEDEGTTIARMKKDLFAEDDVAESEEGEGPKLSSHAKRQLRLAEEIRRLEDENVSKKDWVLMGEASARSRPKDSLLEGELDFETSNRPVPVITEEVSQSLEDMVKARIVEGRFDTVLRKIPESAHKFTKNSFELDENKPTQSLAEVYETEFQKKQNPGEYKSTADKKLEAEHKEIESLFRDLCYNLDSLSSWHYTPKPVTESLNIVTNAPAIDMEDAQPLTMSSASRLAPQEQFTASAEKGEVSGKSGLPISKAEMTSEERQKYRRKQRAVAKKSGAQKKQNIYANMSKSKQEQAGVIDTLKQANVKIIRNGKTKDLKSGQNYNGATAALKPSNLKL